MPADYSPHYSPDHPIFNSSHKYVDDRKLNSWYIANIQFEDYTSLVLTIILEQGKTKFKLKPAFLTLAGQKKNLPTEPCKSIKVQTLATYYPNYSNRWQQNPFQKPSCMNHIIRWDWPVNQCGLVYCHNYSNTKLENLYELGKVCEGTINWEYRDWSAS